VNSCGFNAKVETSNAFNAFLSMHPGIAYAQVRTVAEAKNSPDDTPVQLRGKIERRFNDHKYLLGVAYTV
jgi:uncharacterized protein YdeI (BOF family)